MQRAWKFNFRATQFRSHRRMNAPAANPSTFLLRAEDNRAVSLDHCHTNLHLSAPRDIPNPLHGRETANDINAPISPPLYLDERSPSLSLSLLPLSSSAIRLNARHHRPCRHSWLPVRSRIIPFLLSLALSLPLLPCLPW